MKIRNPKPSRPEFYRPGHMAANVEEAIVYERKLLAWKIEREANKITRKDDRGLSARNTLDDLSNEIYHGRF